MAAQGQNKPLCFSHPYLICHPRCSSAACPLHPPSFFFFFFSTTLSFLNVQKFTDLCVAASHRCGGEKLRNSPLDDLRGVRICKSAGTWFLGAFKKVPQGGNCQSVLKRPQRSAVIRIYPHLPLILAVKLTKQINKNNLSDAEHACDFPEN